MFSSGIPARRVSNFSVMKCIIFLAQSHMAFRQAELESLAGLYGVEVDLLSHDVCCPFMVVEVRCSVAVLEQWISRLVLCRSVYEYWGDGDDFEGLHAAVKSQEHGSIGVRSFKFDYIGYQGSRPMAEQIALFEEFEYLGFAGPIRLKKPDEEFVILEDFERKKVYFGRTLAVSARESYILDTYELKKRRYVGTTSFDAELALVSCNIAQADFNRILYDPFVGTGSFLVAAAKFGAITLGSDIDMKTLIGKKNCNINSNFKQYGTELNFIDVCTMDFTHNCLRPGFQIDSICCDPPYGVREGLKVCGTSRPEHFVGKELIEIDGQKAFLRRDYIQPKKAYLLGNMLDDLLEFGALRLPVGGRLVFWMPVANDEEYNTVIPYHEKLKLKYNCVQKFNKWSRRMLCYVKMGQEYKGETRKSGDGDQKEFRERYFTGFREIKAESEVNK